MARAGNPEGLSPEQRGLTRNVPDRVDTPVIPLSRAKEKYRGLRLISEADAEASGLCRDDLEAIDDIWGALLDSGRMSNERAVEVFDRVMGWVGLPVPEEQAS